MKLISERFIFIFLSSFHICLYDPLLHSSSFPSPPSSSSCIVFLSSFPFSFSSLPPNPPFLSPPFLLPSVSPSPSSSSRSLHHSSSSYSSFFLIVLSLSLFFLLLFIILLIPSLQPSSSLPPSCQSFSRPLHPSCSSSPSSSLFFLSPSPPIPLFLYLILSNPSLFFLSVAPLIIFTAYQHRWNLKTSPFKIYEKEKKN